MQTGNGAPGESVFQRDDGGWRGSGVNPLPQFGTNGSRITLLSRDALAWEDFAEWLPLAVDAVSPEMAAAWQETLSFMEWHAAAYVPWVQRFLPDIAHLDEADYLWSGSSGSRAGLIHASVHYQPAPLAEILVHEGTHQYYHLLGQLGPVDDGTDTTLYYLPAAGMNRPLHRIVLAYHALANVLLFYRLCRANEAVDDGYCGRNEAKLAPQIEQLEAPLRDNPVFTAVGRGLCEPLIERVHQCV
jgi:HEXXH motif-containing protein